MVAFFRLWQMFEIKGNILHFMAQILLIREHDRELVQKED